MPWWLILVIVILCLFVVLPAILFNVTGICVLKMLKKPKEKPNKKNKMPQFMDISFYLNGPTAKLADEGLKFLEGVEKEEISLKSFDGLDLHAYFIKGNSHKYFLGMHGFRSGPLHEFAPYVKGYMERDFNILLASERAEYKSGGKYITLGNKEAFDALGWINYIISLDKEAEIIVEGISMGGATVNILSGMNLPINVKGIISDCAYSSVDDELEFFLKQQKGAPVKFILDAVYWYLRMYLKIDTRKNSPINSVKQSKTPILYLHGRKDQIVPYHLTNKLYDACASEKRIYIVKEANHAESFAYLQDEYFTLVYDLFKLK